MSPQKKKKKQVKRVFIYVQRKRRMKKKIKIKKLLFLNIKNLKPIQFTCYKSVLKLKFVQA